MVQPTLDRQTFLTFRRAGGLAAPGGFSAEGAAVDGAMALKPFVHSPTVTAFANGLYNYWLYSDETDFPPLRRMIDAEFMRTATPDIYYWGYRPMIKPIPKGSEADKIERRRAAFLARLAVEDIAPRALRRAGFEQLAAEVASGVLKPAAAQHALGAVRPAYYPAAGPPSPMSMLYSCAYCASAHASTAAFYAALPEIDSIPQAGRFCAAALLNAFFSEDIAVENPAEVWNFAVAAINTAIELHDAEVGAVLG